MKRYMITNYASDTGTDLIQLTGSTAKLCTIYRSWSADELRELGHACLAAAEELSATTRPLAEIQT